MSVRKMKELATNTSCTTKCPLGISPQGYVGLTKIGKFDEAFELVWSKNPLPSVCAHICHHPCEEGCKRGLLVDEPIQIREIKRYLSEKVDYTPKKYIQKYDERIAIIGAGPAGLTAGHYLATAGYHVTIFESDSKPGGMLVRGIPEFRLNRDVVERDIQHLIDVGLDIRLNEKINKYSVEQMKYEYDAIIVAAGTPHSTELLIDGFRLAGIMTATRFMEYINNYRKPRRHLGQLFKFQGGKAVIIGGGSVAVDCARSAVRAGTSKVTMVCRRPVEETPAHKWELEEAIAEGVEIIGGYVPVAFTSELFPTLNGVKFEKVISRTRDENGKVVIKTDKENPIVIECDWCVEAVGQKADDFWSDIAEPGVFFAGDISSNKCSVIDAMASGRKTAMDVDAAIRGRQLKGSTIEMADRLTPVPVEEKLFPYNFRKIVRPHVSKLEPEVRVKTFANYEGVFTDKEAHREADCCLGCGYETVNAEKCIGCGMCARLCPKGDVITLIAKEKGE